MKIDFHTHIFPPSVCKNREAFFIDEPAFHALYSPPQSKLAGANDLIATMDVHQIDRSVVFGFPWKSEETTDRHNDYILESIRKYPDRLIGFACVDPLSNGAEQAVVRCLDEGFSGVGELGFYQQGITDESISALKPIMKICLAAQVPVLIHTNEPVGRQYAGKSPNTLSGIYQMVRTFPDNKIVLAHWGGGLFFYHLLKREVKTCLKHVYYDTAASPFLYDPAVYRHAKAIVGVEKILWGTDYPLLKPDRYMEELESVGLEKEDRDKICGGNAENLLNLT